MNKKINFQFNQTFKDLGIKEIAFALITDIDNHLPLLAEYENMLLATEKTVLSMDNVILEKNEVLQGYRYLIKSINRSLKKFPPSAQALIDNVKKRHAFPRINSVVDIYNTHAIQSYLSLGVHDLDKLTGNTISFNINEKENQLFYPIGGGEKQVNLGDYIYQDQKTILAWLDARDSELVKVTKDTRNIIIIIQGHLKTSIEYRLQTLTAICQAIKLNCGGHYEICSVTVDNSVVQKCV